MSDDKDILSVYPSSSSRSSSICPRQMSIKIYMIVVLPNFRTSTRQHRTLRSALFRLCRRLRKILLAITILGSFITIMLQAFLSTLLKHHGCSMKCPPILSKVNIFIILVPMTEITIPPHSTQPPITLFTPDIYEHQIKPHTQIIISDSVD